MTFYKILISTEESRMVLDDVMYLPDCVPHEELPDCVSAYIRAKLENIMLTEEERAKLRGEK